MVLGWTSPNEDAWAPLGWYDFLGMVLRGLVCALVAVF